MLQNSYKGTTAQSLTPRSKTVKSSCSTAITYFLDVAMESPARPFINCAFHFMKNQAVNESGHLQALVHVQKGRDFIKHVHIGIPTHCTSDHKMLQFSSAQIFHIAIQQVHQIQIVDIAVHHAALVMFLHECLDCGAVVETSHKSNSNWGLVAEHHFETIVHQDSLKVIYLEVGSTEMRHNQHPI
jgi:hypothetical protein